MSQPTILSSTAFDDGRCIEALENGRGELYYRVCSAGSGTCRYCEDLWMAHLYADQLCPERQSSG